MGIGEASPECSVEGCESPSRARGWCPKHWKRWKAHGDPTYLKVASHVRGGSNEERFWPKVEPTGFCWIWKGSLGRHGHGYFNLGADENRRGVAAHKFAYETLVGIVPDGLELDHLCRNPPCVNPDHLEPVTHAENLRRGFAPSNVINRRQVCGEGHDISKPEQVYVTKSGRRTCKKCTARRQREYLDRKKAEF